MLAVTKETILEGRKQYPWAIRLVSSLLSILKYFSVFKGRKKIVFLSPICWERGDSGVSGSLVVESPRMFS